MADKTLSTDEERCAACDHPIGDTRGGKCLEEELRERPDLCWGENCKPVDWRARALVVETALTVVRTEVARVTQERDLERADRQRIEAELDELRARFDEVDMELSAVCARRGIAQRERDSLHAVGAAWAGELVAEFDRLIDSARCCLEGR